MTDSTQTPEPEANEGSPGLPDAYAPRSGADTTIILGRQSPQIPIWRRRRVCPARNEPRSQRCR